MPEQRDAPWIVARANQRARMPDFHRHEQISGLGSIAQLIRRAMLAEVQPKIMSGRDRERISRKSSRTRKTERHALHPKPVRDSLRERATVNVSEANKNETVDFVRLKREEAVDPTDDVFELAEQKAHQAPMRAKTLSNA